VYVPLPSAHLPLVQDTVARLHDMIAIIEGGQLPEPAHDLIATLGELEDEQAMPAAESAPLPVEDVPDVSSAQVVETLIEPSIEPTLIETVSLDEPGEMTHVHVSSGPLDVSALVLISRRSRPCRSSSGVKSPMKSIMQLLPIFLEEADSLVPDTSAQLRAWKAAPGETAARDALRRTCTPSREVRAWLAPCAWRTDACDGIAGDRRHRGPAGRK